MRCPLVTIRESYRDPQRRSKYGRAREEYMVWLHARGVFVRPPAVRMRRHLRVWFVPDGTTFQEEPTHQYSRESRCWKVPRVQAHPTRHARTFLRTRRARANERRQRVC